VPSWATTIQSLEVEKPDHVPPSLPGNTLRQFIWPTLSGGQVRIQLSNEKGAEPLDVAKVHIALAKTAADANNSNGEVDPSTDAAFTFSGMPNVTIPAGMTVWSDGIDFSLEHVKLTAISIQFGQSIPTNITNHPGSRTTSYFATGDAVATGAMNGGETRDRWYFINALEVMAPADASAIACLGDSITDGYGVLNKFARWTDALTLAIKADPTIASKRSVLNFGMGANELTASSTYQDSGLVRFERDVLTRDKVKYLIVLEGVNDINNTARTPPVTAQTLTDAYGEIVEQARAKGIKVWVSPLTPMNAANSMRDAVNAAVRAADYYDTGIDFDIAIRETGNPNNTQAAFKNDALHPSDVGYKAMGDSIDLTLFY
jgi:lysophospholipase L1-like esterase